MLLRTHYIFTAGLLLLILRAMHEHGFLLYVLAIITSVVSNKLIDGLGHEVKGGFIRRTPLTHTFPRSMLWGVVGAIPAIFLYYIINHSTTALIYILTAGAIAGLSHMLLDVFTEKGIYVKKNGRWVRFALAHYKYDDPLINGLAVLVGAVMLYASIVW